ncbi:glycosyltransferase family 4 protein [Thalassotalea piscium]
MNILILTNMCKTEAEPSSGLYVRRQFEFLKCHPDNQFTFDYYEMPKSCKQTDSAVKRYLGFFFAFVKQHIFSRKKYALLHVHFYFPTILLAVFYKCFRSPSTKIVVTFHGSDIYGYRNFAWWYRACFRFVDYSIFVSRSLKNSFFKLKTKHEVFCAGIDPIFYPQKKSIKYEFIFVGHLDENKGVHRLVELIKKLPQTKKLLIVGHGPLSEYVQRNIKNDNVTLFSKCAPYELVSLYLESKWLINLSHNESFGLTMAEALVCGVPVVATCTDGALEQIENNVNGFLIDQKSDVIEKLIDLTSSVSANDYRKMEKSAIKHKEKCSIDVVTERNLTIYRDLLL